MRASDHAGPEFYSVHSARDWFPDPSIHVAVWRAVQGTAYREHSHEFFETVIILKGSINHLIYGNSILATAGDVFNIPPGVEHGYRSPLDCSAVSVIYDERVIKDHFRDLTRMPEYRAFMHLEPTSRKDETFGKFLKLAPKELIVLNELVKCIEMELEKRQAGYQHVAAAYLIELIVLICRYYALDTTVSSDVYVSVARCINHIEANLSRPLTLDYLVDISHMSRRTFIRHFKKVTGESPVHFLHRLRIERARGALAETDLNVTEVAEYVGFNDSNNFSRAFKEATGMSPLAYRKMGEGSTRRAAE